MVALFQNPSLLSNGELRKQKKQQEEYNLYIIYTHYILLFSQPIQFCKRNHLQYFLSMRKYAKILDTEVRIAARFRCPQTARVYYHPSSCTVDDHNQRLLRHDDHDAMDG
ncbi:hypothetical protein CDL12_16733 [Handroanthus impetiginosus]|uniref:Uncharacterized protein n=1 Tax=Handroanthus impetiginosus TaxID=429701 RepID=A0A2G9GZJ2_9LAMI|nr:hypothetical protein CDL12_16733 [Handroanthus impetiginosus]